ncbi:MAG: DUF2341 domain-containing protein [Candidatus Aenigmatarchaeota archaeon]
MNKAILLLVAVLYSLSIAAAVPVVTIMSPANTTYVASSIDFNVSLSEEGSSCRFVYDKTWFESSFRYRKPITITNTAEDLTNYQVAINITEALYNNKLLVGSWHFSEASGNRSVDLSGYGNDGICTNMPNLNCNRIAGKSGNGVMFDGENDYVYLSNPAALAISNTFTVELWLKALLNQADYFYPISHGHTSKEGWALQGNGSTGKITVIMNGGCSKTFSTSVSDNIWHHLVSVKNTTGTYLFMDGVLDGSCDGGGDVVNVTKWNVTIGNDKTTDKDRPFNGTMDEVRIYNRSLTAQEIADRYNAVKGRLDYADVRFSYYVSSSGSETQLNYWLENEKQVWLNVTSLPGNKETLVYMYYGNPSATSPSDVEKTFEFFDDFTGTTINTAKWNENDAGEYISQGNMIIITNGQGTWDSTTMFTDADFSFGNIELTFKIKPMCQRGTTYKETTMVGWKNKGTGNSYTDMPHAIYFTEQAGANTVSIYEDGIKKWSGGTFVCGTQYWGKIKLKSAGADYYISTDGANWNNLYTGTSSNEAPLKVGFTHYQGGDTYIDDFLIRKYASAEPSVAIGNEEQLIPMTKFNLTYFNHTASVGGGYHHVTFYCTDTGANIVNTVKRYFTVNPPFITVISPANATLGVSTIDFNLSLGEKANWCDISIDGVSRTNMTKLNSTYFTIIRTLPDGFHNVTFYCNDTNGMVDVTRRYFTINARYPMISYNPGTTLSGGPLNNVFINVSVIDNNIDKVGYSWNNVNYTVWDEIKGTDYWVYKTLAMNGTYSFYAWVNDTTGNMNITETRSVTKGQLCKGASIKVTAIDVASIERKVTVTVYNDGESDGLEIKSAYIYDNNGKKFSASGLPLYGFDRLKSKVVVFDDVEIINCNDFSKIEVTTNCKDISVSSKENCIDKKPDVRIEISNKAVAGDDIIVSIKNLGKESLSSKWVKVYVDDVEKECSQEFTIEPDNKADCRITHKCSGVVAFKVVGPQNQDETEIECGNAIKIETKICSDKKCSQELAIVNVGQSIYINAETDATVKGATMKTPGGDSRTVNLDSPVTLDAGPGRYEITIDLEKGELKDKKIISIEAVESAEGFLNLFNFVVLAIVVAVLIVVYIWFRKNEDEKIIGIISKKKMALKR